MSRVLLRLATACVVASSTPFAAGDLLEAGFRSPALEDRPMVWWHWMNGSVTKESIRAELEDMKRVGLAGAQMLDVTPGFTKETLFPPGPVRWGSNQWHEHWQFAIRTAGELGLKLGMMNCAGWSESGGPWVTPEDSMKKVVWSEVAVEGGQSARVKMPVPRANFDFYRDITVLAVPADAVDKEKPSLSSSLANVDVSRLVDGRTEAEGAVAFPRGTENLTLTFTFPQPVERRLLVITAPYQRGAEVRLGGDIEVSDDGVRFRKVRAFGFPGGLYAHKGYIGTDLNLNAPFEPTRGKVFHVAFKGMLSPLNIAEVALSGAYRIENYQSKTLTSPLGSLLPPKTAPTEDPAAIPLRQVIDVSASLRPDGTLDWQPPAGRWTVLRFGYTTTGLPNHPAQDEGTGLEVDKMSKAALGRHFEAALGRVLREAGPLKGRVLTSVLSDSWEAAQQNWTADFAEEFRARRGYDLKPFLPVLAGRVVGSLGDAEGFLEDFRRTCSDLICENYFAEMRRLTSAHGLLYYGESYGGKAYNEYQAATNVGVNMAEFWFLKDRGKFNVGGIKARASIAHTLGRKILAAESFTATQGEAGWSANPYLLKSIGDLAFSNGLNQIFLHSYVHQPYPALAPGFTVGSSGSNFGRLNTWWPRANAWVDYLARCQFLLKQGDFVADVLLMKNAGIGSFTSDKFPPIPAGYDYDEIDPSLLRDATVVDGGVRLSSGATYRVLALTATWVADLPLLRKLELLVDGGAVVIGPPPYAPAGRMDEAARESWRGVVAKLWAKGAASVVPAGAELAKVLAELRVEPDCRITPVAPTGTSLAPVSYLHRRSANADIYFLSTTSDQPVRFRADFRVGNKQPELWDAMTGAAIKAPVFHTDGARTTLDLALGDSGSIFVVFRAAPPAKWATVVSSAGGQPAFLNDTLATAPDGTVYATTGEAWRVKWNDGREETLPASAPTAAPFAIEGTWAVTFTTPAGKTIVRNFARLQSWTDADDELRYFSGSAIYRLAFVLPAGRVRRDLRALLDLGAVHDLATVTVNSYALDTLWTPPFRADVSALLNTGRNTLEIEVRNRWVNRLMGDDKLPQDVEHQQKLKNGRSWGIIAKFPEWMHDPAKIVERPRSTFVTYQTYYKPEDTLPVSGLVGPVTIRFAPVVSLVAK